MPQIACLRLRDFLEWKVSILWDRGDFPLWDFTTFWPLSRKPKIGHPRNDAEGDFSKTLGLVHFRLKSPYNYFMYHPTFARTLVMRKNCAMPWLWSMSTAHTSLDFFASSSSGALSILWGRPVSRKLGVCVFGNLSKEGKRCLG